MAGQLPVPIPPGIAVGAGTVRTITSANGSITVTDSAGPNVGMEVATSPKLDGVAAATYARTVTPATKLVTFASGVAQVVTATHSTTVMVQLDAAVAGHVTAAIGPTSTAVHVVCATLDLLASSDELLTIPVPAGWYVKITVVTLTIHATSLAVTGA